MNRPLHASVKQDSLIILRVIRFPNLFSNLNWLIFVCKETDICDIHICRYLYLLDIFNQENLYMVIDVCSNRWSKNRQRRKLPLDYL